MAEPNAAPDKQGIFFKGRVKSHQVQQAKPDSGYPDRYFIFVDALGIKAVLKVEVDKATFDKLQDGDNYISKLDYELRDKWLTFKPV